jgi:hypothetical protein
MSNGGALLTHDGGAGVCDASLSLTIQKCFPCSCGSSGIYSVKWVFSLQACGGGSSSLPYLSLHWSGCDSCGCCSNSTLLLCILQAQTTVSHHMSCNNRIKGSLAMTVLILKEPVCFDQRKS